MAQSGRRLLRARSRAAGGCGPADPDCPRPRAPRVPAGENISGTAAARARRPGPVSASGPVTGRSGPGGRPGGVGGLPAPSRGGGAGAGYGAGMGGGADTRGAAPVTWGPAATGAPGPYRYRAPGPYRYRAQGPYRYRALGPYRAAWPPGGPIPARGWRPGPPPWLGCGVTSGRAATGAGIRVGCGHTGAGIGRGPYGIRCPYRTWGHPPPCATPGQDRRRPRPGRGARTPPGLRSTRRVAGRPSRSSGDGRPPAGAGSAEPAPAGPGGVVGPRRGVMKQISNRNNTRQTAGNSTASQALYHYLRRARFCGGLGRRGPGPFLGASDLRRQGAAPAMSWTRGPTRGPEGRLGRAARARRVQASGSKDSERRHACRGGA